jgi:hypothetical protein
MMTDREKLIEILRVPICPHELADPTEVVADYLLDNGVTFATDNNVGSKNRCDYCQEDADGYFRMFGAFAITNPFHGKEWFLETAHCKPRNIFFCPKCGRKLAEPPKEGE